MSSNSEERFTRILNLSGDTPDWNGARHGKNRVLTTLPHCDFCCGEGWVVVDIGMPADQIEDLHAIWSERTREFVKARRRRPNTRESLAIRVEVVYGERFAPCPFCEAGFVNEFSAKDAGGKEIWPSWGRNGYWRERSPLIAKTCTHFEEPMPIDQVIEGMRQMAGIIGKEVISE